MGSYFKLAKSDATHYMASVFPENRLPAWTAYIMRTGFRRQRRFFLHLVPYGIFSI